MAKIGNRFSRKGDSSRNYCRRLTGIIVQRHIVKVEFITDPQLTKADDLRAVAYMERESFANSDTRSTPGRATRRTADSDDRRNNQARRGRN
jgi:hypothetical protein